MHSRPVVAALVLFAIACAKSAPMPAPAIRPIGNAKNWMLTEPLVYRVGTSSDSVIVPRGFVTDFASIPPWLQSVIQPMGPHLLPSIVHDYLYWEQGCTRAQADSLFLKAMIEHEVPADDARNMHSAVAIFGKGAWSGNTRERTAGLPRIVPDTVRQPGPLESWDAYRAFLYSAGVRPGPPAGISPAFCARASERLIAHGVPAG